MRKYARRYIQQHAIPVDLPRLPQPKYDGITELWFDSTDDIVALFTDAEYMATIRPDEERFLDLHGCDFLVTAENVVLAG